MDILKSAKQLITNVSDEINRKRWDPNCINRALFTEENAIPALQPAETGPVKQDMSKFQAQINERNERVRSGNNDADPKQEKNPVGADGFIPLSELPKIDPSQSISSIGKAPEVQKPETVTVGRKGSALFPEHEVPIEEAEGLEALMPAVVEKAEPATVALAEPCYYVKIIHKNTYPKPGSVNIMRMCDKAYVWQDTKPESEVPTYTTCPGCGKRIERTETEMD